MRKRLAGVALLVAIATPAMAEATSAQNESCNRAPNGLAVVVNLDNEEHRGTISHVFAAVLEGQPRVLHIDRADADVHRRASLRGIPTRAGFDRDEYPPASSREGGAGASVAYVRSHDNRSAGSKMGHDLAGYCEDQPFILEP